MTWLNDRSNSPCEGHPLGTAALDSGTATWWIDAGDVALEEAAEGSFVSVCSNGTPLASGNLRSTG